MSDETQSVQNDPASIIAQVLNDSVDSGEDANAIATRIVATLADAGVVCTGPETAEAQ